MNELLEKAKRDYPIGTKFRSMYVNSENVVTKPIFIQHESIYTTDDNFEWITIYDLVQNQWAEIIKEETMTQQEFNALKVGETLGEWEILHKYKELLIIEDKRGYDLVDLAKINKLGLKVKPKTFMGLEVKEYDNVPCEMDGCLLVYLIEVKDNCIFYKPSRNFKPNQITPTSIKLL